VKGPIRITAGDA